MTVALRLSSFFPFLSFFRFVNKIFVCFFVENSSHLGWLAVVSPNANRLFSEIPLPPAKNFKLAFSISLECS